ncbi:MAG: ATP synthase F0 subunit B [Geobacteraceae bacterium]
MNPLHRIIMLQGNFLQIAILCSSIILLATAGFAAEAVPHAESGAQLKDFLFRLFNFALLAGILAWALKYFKVKELLAARRTEVAKTLRDAEEIREEAERKLTEYNEKLEKASREIDEIHAAIKHEGEVEKSRIIQEAKEAAERIRSQAQIAANQEIKQATARLQAETARLAVQLAKTSLKQSVTPNDQDRFVDEYLKKVVEG